MRRLRAKRRAGSEGGGGGEDRLSSLPDELLHHIMHFMRTKIAVRTCVLSRRWRHVWSSCPNLHFDESDVRNQYPYNFPFMNFVDRALLFNEAPKLNRLCVVARGATDMSRVSSWVHTGIRRNVSHLTLCIRRKNQSLYLPPQLFHLHSLKRLILLVTDSRTQPLHWPDQTTMPLEELTLLGFRIANDIPSSCPCLKSWRMARCTAPSKLDLSNCPNLEILSVNDIKGVRDLVLSGPSLTDITISKTFYNAAEGAATTLEISAPKLRSIVLSDIPAHRYECNSKMFPSRANVLFRSAGGRDVLLSLDVATHLTIDCFSLWSCIQDDPLPDSLYRNLEVVQLLLDTSIACVATAMHNSLGCFPNLKTLDIRNMKLQRKDSMNQRFSEASTTFKVQDFNKHQFSSLRQLREVGYDNFTGSCWEVGYIKCILGAAPELQVITFTASASFLTHNFSRIVKELQKLPAASPRVKLRFKHRGSC